MLNDKLIKRIETLELNNKRAQYKRMKSDTLNQPGSRIESDFQPSGNIDLNKHPCSKHQDRMRWWKLGKILKMTQPIRTRCNGWRKDEFPTIGLMMW